MPQSNRVFSGELACWPTWCYPHGVATWFILYRLLLDVDATNVRWWCYERGHDGVVEHVYISGACSSLRTLGIMDAWNSVDRLGGVSRDLRLAIQLSVSQYFDVGRWTPSKLTPA